MPIADMQIFAGRNSLSNTADYSTFFMAVQSQKTKKQQRSLSAGEEKVDERRIKLNTNVIRIFFFKYIKKITITRHASLMAVRGDSATLD